jgi:hypothetical protein
MIGMHDRKRLWKGGHSALKAPLIPHPALADIALMVNDPAAAERTLRQPTLHGQFHEAFALGQEHAAFQISQYCRTRLVISAKSSVEVLWISHRNELNPYL